MTTPLAYPHRAARTLITISALLLLALGMTSCAAPSKRIADPSCEHCYRTESGILFKTWAAYDP